MKRLFFDIETIPSAEEDKASHLKVIRARRNRRGSPAAMSDDALHAQTSLDGTFGRIVCIGFIKESNGKVRKGVLTGQESDILLEFWKLAKDVDQFIGHCILEFDFPFIYQRSVIHGVKPRFDISFSRYTSAPIFDTMHEWTKWSGRVSLNTLSNVLGFESSKGNLDGSKVWPYYQAGRLDEIYEYCLKDVELTRKIYQRISFEDFPD
jgi:predicted PolB exonuclease-like 3'-5' exonuclease